MKKKKLLALGMVAALSTTAVVGGTLAYFTDSDADRNVMTAGNIVIVQNETDRDGEAYEDEQALLPAVYLKDGKPYNPTTTWEGPAGGAKDTYTDSTGATKNITGPNDEPMDMYADNINNEIDKVISVTNGGTLPAYIRTIVLMENTADNAICEKIHGMWGNDDGQYRKWVVKDDGTEDMLTIDDTSYSIAVCAYNSELGAGETSSPSLKQVWLDPSADNEWYELLGEDGRFSIIAFSQAVQTEGFEDAAQALNTAFGEVNSANVAKWLAETPIKTTDFANVVGGN